MKYMYFVPILLLCMECGNTPTHKHTIEYKGITFVASPNKVASKEFQKIKELGANFVALVPYGFQSNEIPKIKYHPEKQWWGETPNGIEECIQLAKTSGLKVMLKPQIYIHDGWTGNVEYQTEEDWLLWEESYQKFILQWVEIAVKHNIEMLCIGTEYDRIVIKREIFWRKLIKDIRNTYHGKLTYSANWTDYHKIPIWDALDIIGISAYFPISESKHPTSKQLRQGWRDVIQQLRKTATTFQKPLLFTEFGYMSVDGAAGKHWKLEENIATLPINEEAQMIAITSLFHNLSTLPEWKGGFLWKWFPSSMLPHRDISKGYTPQNKKAENALKRVYLNS